MSISLVAPSSLLLGREATQSDVRHRSDIDGLRAVAILAVVGFHAFPLAMPGGFVGVDVFFVISGYLITGIVVRDLQAGKFSLANFYARRVRRLFPALIVVLPAVLIMGWLILLPDEYRRLGTAMAAGAGFAANLIANRDLGAYFYNTQQEPLIHLWSLGVEEQFYLMWPLLLMAVWKFRGAALVVLAMVTIASFVSNVITISSDALGAFYLPWNRLWELSMGGLLGYWQSRDRDAVISARLNAPAALARGLAHGHHIAGILGSVLIIGSIATLRGTDDFPGWWAAIPTSGALLLIAAGPHCWINRHVLSQRWMVFLGLISYPLYLWHWPLLAFAHVTGGRTIPGSTSVPLIVAAFVLAYLTYRYVESPIRRSQQAGHAVLLLGGCMTICLFASLLVLTNAIPSRALPHEVNRFATAASEDWLGETGRAWTGRVDELIVLGNQSRSAVFIGDSHMEHYYPRIHELIGATGGVARGAVFSVRGACPPVPELALVYGKAGCGKQVGAALDYARRDNVDTVVLGAAWPVYLVVLQDDRYVLKPDADRALASLRELIADLRTRGKSVYVVLPSPTHPSFDPRTMIRRTLLPPGFDIQVPSPPRRADVEPRFALIATELRRLAVETGAETIDPMEFLCPGETCPSFTPAGEVVYHDAGHLNPTYVRRYVRFLDEIILEAQR